MNPTKQRIAIAKACGWVSVQQDAECKLMGINPNNDPECIPDYLNDLNAMNKAERYLIREDKLKNYTENLYYVINQSSVKATGCEFDDLVTGNEVAAHCMVATAAQRAEAFLKTLNLWNQ